MRAVTEEMPGVAEAARLTRRFQDDAVRTLVDRGVRQFLDIGTGLPVAGAVHETAQRLAPESRVVYVDNDPIVLAHARALLVSTEEGATAYIDADLRDPDKILGDPRLQQTLDLSQPVALMLIGILHFIPDHEEPHRLVGRLLAALPAGSYLVLQQPTTDFYEPGPTGTAAACSRAGIPFQYRTRDEFARFFTGLELVPPGIELMSEWRAEGEPQPRPAASDVGAYAAIGRKA